MRVLAKEKLEQGVQRHRVGHDFQLALDPHQIGIGLLDQLEQVLDVNEADGVVEVAFDQRKTGVLAAHRDFQNLLERLVRIEDDDLVPRSHHVAHPEFVQAEGVDEDLALGLGDFLGLSALLD